MRGATPRRLLAVAFALGVLAGRSGFAQDPSARADRPLTFAQDIAPILREHCVDCHRPDSWGPFNLVTYADVRPRARQIAEAVKRRAMPPWKPEPGFGGPFLGERRLSDAEIARIERWVEQGSTAGADGHDAAELARLEGWQLGAPDLVVSMPRAYTLPPGRRDVLRNFVLPIPISTMKYVRGIELQPSNRRIAHHANMRIDRSAASKRLDEQDPEPGYSGVTPPTAVYPDGYLLAWTPGQTPQLLPPGLAWRLEPGSSLIVQMHMPPADESQSMQLRVGFYFTDIAPQQTPAQLRLGRQNIDIPPGEQKYVIQDAYTLPVDVEVQAVQPHAHLLPREVKGLATLPDGTTRWLIYIKNWDFYWQDVYRYREPFWLPKGTTLHMEITYDNSPENRRNPSVPPKRVRFGQQTTDEMGDLWVQVLPRDRSDLGKLLRDYERKERAEDVNGYRTMLQAAPNDATLHDGLARSLISLGRFTEGVAEAEASVRLEDSDVTQYNLATALAIAGRRAEAADHFRRAIQLNPSHAYAHNSLGALLLEAGQSRDAVDEFRIAARIDPLYQLAHYNLGVGLERMGRLEESIEEYRRAIQITPDHERAHFALAGALESSGRYAESIASYRRALSLNPDDPSTLTRLAWVLATASDPALRRPDEAVQLAEEGLGHVEREDAVLLDRLAAAYAAAGRFGDAVAAEERALRAAASGAGRSLTTEIQGRLELYRRGVPYREGKH